MTRPLGERIIHWYCKHCRLASLICHENVHLKDIHSIRITILQTAFSYHMYFQSFLLCLFTQDYPELVSVHYGQNYFLVDCLISMAVGWKTFFIEKKERHFQKRLLNHYFEAVTCYSIGNPRANTDIKYHFHSSGIFLTEEYNFTNRNVNLNSW